jgi:hypothetical protein
MRAKLTLLASVRLLALLGAGAMAGDGDGILAAIDQGREAFQAGKDQEAIAKLQKAIGLIQARAIQALGKFLPARDAAQWDAGEVESQAGNWGSGETAFQWSQVTRSYTKKGVDDGPQVSVMISNSPGMIEAQGAILQMLKDPAMRAMITQAQEGQKVEVVEDGAWLGMITTSEHTCTLLAMHGKVMVQVEVRPGGDDKLAKEFWGALDRAGLAAATK